MLQPASIMTLWRDARSSKHTFIFYFRARFAPRRLRGPNYPPLRLKKKMNGVPPDILQVYVLALTENIISSFHRFG